MQNEVNGNGDNSSTANAHSARPTAYLKQKITSDFESSLVPPVLSSAGRKSIEESSSAKKASEAPRVQHFSDNTSDKSFSVATSESQTPLRQQVGSSVGDGLGNEPLSTRTSPGRQQLERTSSKKISIVETSKVSQTDGNKDQQVSRRVTESRTLTSKSLKSSSSKGKIATDPPKVARTASRNALEKTAGAVIDGNKDQQVSHKATESRILTSKLLEASSLKGKIVTDSLKVARTTSKNALETTTIAVITRKLKTTESIVTMKETTSQTQKTIMKTSIGKSTQKEKYREISTAKLDENKSVLEETTTKASVITDLNMRTTKRKRTFAVSKLQSRSTYRKTKKKQTSASKPTSKQTFIVTLLPSTKQRYTANVSARHMLTTTEEAETTDEEMIGIQNLAFKKKRSKNEQKPQQMNKSALPFILGVIAGALVVAAVLASVVLIMIVYHRKRNRRKTQTDRLMVKQPPKARKMPRKMESANISATKFSHAGPLVLDAKLKGPVRHALEDNTTGAALSKVQFDPKLNEIVDIGTDVDVINDSRITTAATTTETGQAVKKTNQSVRSVIPKTAKISDRLFTDKKKPKNEKATKTAALPPNPTAAAVTKPLKET